VDPDDDEAARIVVLLDDLVGDAHQRAAHPVLVEDDLLSGHGGLLVGLTGPG
jgi:hypothetical protein